MKTIEIAIDSPAGRTVCELADALGLDPQDVLQGILFGICNRKKRQDASHSSRSGEASCTQLDLPPGKHASTKLKTKPIHYETILYQ